MAIEATGVALVHARLSNWYGDYALMEKCMNKAITQKYKREGPIYFGHHLQNA